MSFDPNVVFTHIFYGIRMTRMISPIVNRYINILLSKQVSLK